MICSGRSSELPLLGQRDTLFANAIQIVFSFDFTIEMKKIEFESQPVSFSSRVPMHRRGDGNGGLELFNVL